MDYRVATRPDMLIAVVGHGRSPEQRGWGSLIDDCDVVLRLWDWEWQDKEDYGRKYDIGYYTANRFYIKKLTEFSLARPSVTWIGQVLVEPNRRMDVHTIQGAKTKLFDDTGWLKIGTKLGGKGNNGRFILSRGACTACWAAENIQDGSTLVLVGFDNVRAETVLPLDEAFPPAFRTNQGTISFSGYPTEAGQTKEGPHDFAVEGKIIQAVAKKHCVEVVHAQDFWE